MAEHPHLFVGRKGKGIPFRGVAPVIRTPRVPRGNRRAHIETLVGAVDAAVERNAQRITEQVLVPEAERGFYPALCSKRTKSRNALWNLR